jgi:hypothetical protein
MNDELQSVWKDELMAFTEHYPSIWRERQNKIAKNIRCPHREWKQAYPERELSSPSSRGAPAPSYLFLCALC